MASRWFGGYVSNLSSPWVFFFLVFRIRQCHWQPGISVFRVFMPATGAKPEAAKTNLMDCSCLCSEVEIFCRGLQNDKEKFPVLNF